MADIDLRPLFRLLSMVADGEFYVDHDESLEVLGAAWETYFEIESEMRND